MKLKEMLDAGMSVIGSPLEKRLKPVLSMSETTLRRMGYADPNGCLTERGHDRMISSDQNRLDSARQKYLKSKV